MASESTKSKFDVFVEEKYVPLDQKIKIVAVIVVVAALLVGFYLLVLAPNLEEIKKLESQKFPYRQMLIRQKKLQRI